MGRARSHRLGRVLAGVLLIGATAAAAQPPSADDLQQLQQDLQGRQDQREEWRTQGEAARRELARLNTDLSNLSIAAAQGEMHVTDKKTALADLSVRETALATRVGANRNRLSRMLGALEMYSRNPPPALFVHPDDAKKAVRAAILIKAVMPELQHRAKAYAREVEDARLLRRQVASGSTELFTAESELAEKKARLEAAIAEKEAMVRDMTASTIIADREIAAISGRSETLRKFLGGVRAPLPSSVIGQGPGGFRMPVAAKPIRRFAERESEGARSEGWTWRPGSGAEIIAPATGRIEFAGSLYGWGNILILGANGGYHLVLGGMGSLAVKPGQSVAAGQIVGHMANNGAEGIGSSPSELYLEIRKGAGPVDPAQYMH